MKINISDNAKNEIKRVTEGSNKKPRIYLAGIGCSAARLGLNIDEAREGDVEQESDGVAFLVEGEVSKVIEEVDVNYESEGLKMGFSVKEGDKKTC